MRRFKGKLSIIGKEGMIHVPSTDPIDDNGAVKTFLPLLPKKHSNLQSITPKLVKSTETPKQLDTSLRTPKFTFIISQPRKNASLINKRNRENFLHASNLQKQPDPRRTEKITPKNEAAASQLNYRALVNKMDSHNTENLESTTGKNISYVPYTIQDYKRIKPTNYYRLGSLGPDTRGDKWNMQYSHRRNMIQFGNLVSDYNKSLKFENQTNASPTGYSAREKSIVFSKKIQQMVRNKLELPGCKEELENHSSQLTRQQYLLRRRIMMLQPSCPLNLHKISL